MAPFTIEGACNRSVFEAWIETCLLPALKPGQWLVIDNATFHKGGRIEELMEQQKAENRDFSAQRVKCEHAHAGIKRYHVVTSIYRNRVTDFDDHLMLVATGLWNFYLEAA